jgi:hypothetical protein
MTRLVLLATFALVSVPSARAAELPVGKWAVRFAQNVEQPTDQIKAEVKGRVVCKDTTQAYIRVYRDEGFGLEEEIRIYFRLSEEEWKRWKDVLPKLHDQTVTVTGSLGQIRKGSKTSLPAGALYFDHGFVVKTATETFK